MASDAVLMRLDNCQRLLAECFTVEDAKNLSALAEAARVYAKRVGASVATVNAAVVYRIQAERKMGEALAREPRATGGQPYHGSTGSREEPVDTLDGMGVSKKESSRAQRLAAIPVAVFARAISEAKKVTKELTTVGFVRDVLREVVHGQRKPAVSPEGKYRVIYADPPWRYDNAGLDSYGAAERHYPSMSIDELCAMDVRSLAEDDAVLFLWVTSPMLEDSFRVVNAWGFHYKASFVWDKVRHNFGHYNSVRHEFLLVATRGSCKPEIPDLVDSVIVEERSSKHSEKPECVRAMIDRLYPSGQRIELFARSESPNWRTWGNEPRRDGTRGRMCLV